MLLFTILLFTLSIDFSKVSTYFCKYIFDITGVVFEKSDIPKINKQYKTIASVKELLLQEFMPQIQTLGETSFIFFNKTLI